MMRCWLACKLLLSLLLCAYLTSCGYKFGQSSITEKYHTVSVPFITGDPDGALTNAVVKEIETNSGLEYVNSGGALLLSIALKDVRDEDIGFRYDRDKKERKTRYIIPIETRITAVVELKVIEACSGKNLLGPVILSASVDFDHDYYSSRNGVNIFSLGQLSDIDAARDSVKIPLNRALARKIVEYVVESW